MSPWCPWATPWQGSTTVSVQLITWHHYGPLEYWVEEGASECASTDSPSAGFPTIVSHCTCCVDRCSTCQNNIHAFYTYPVAKSCSKCMRIEQRKYFINTVMYLRWRSSKNQQTNIKHMWKRKFSLEGASKPEKCEGFKIPLPFISVRHMFCYCVSFVSVFKQSNWLVWWPQNIELLITGVNNTSEQTLIILKAGTVDMLDRNV